MKLRCLAMSSTALANSRQDLKPPHAVEPLRRQAVMDLMSMGCPITRGLHSSMIRLNVSTFCGTRRVHYFPPVY